ncbi:MAG: GAF domain-containing protein [Deltaproteobacteria bacterium]|nr:GAF domain-containing protein [Deltaproteobacteria bacterium]
MKREVSCINTLAIFCYAKACHISPDILLDDLDPEIDQSADPVGFLSDPKNWVSTGIIVMLLKRLKTVLGNENVAFELGRFAIENGLIGHTRMMLIKGFWSYKKALKNAQSINDQYSRSKDLELVELKGNKAVVRLHWYPQQILSKDLCLYNQSILIYFPTIWGGRPLEVNEKHCYFEGAPYCEFHLRYPLWNRFHEIYSRIFTSKTILAATIKEMERDKALIQRQYDEVNRLHAGLNQKVEQLLAVQETGKAILSILNLEQLLSVIMDLLGSLCRIRRAIIMLVNEKKGCLEYIYGRGFDGEVSEGFREYRVSLHRIGNALVRVANSGQSEYFEDAVKSNLQKEDILLRIGMKTSVHVVPLITKARVIGVIATDSVETEGAQRDRRETFEILAQQIAIAIENARLYRRLQEQVAELKQSHLELRRAEKFSFLANLADKLAYEIQTPMTEIESFIQQLPERFYDEDFRNDFYQKALEKTNRVNNLILELLDLIKTKESQFEWSDIHGLVEKVLLIVSPQSNAKKIEIIRRFDPDIPYVWMDPDKMKQVVLCILSNAIDFTPEGGRIEIFMSGPDHANDQNYIHIEIKDNGIGIPESHIPRIFDPFFTTKMNGNIQEGTGLGLFIALQNIQDHGGTLEVQSVEKMGSFFTVMLPVKKP